MSTNIVYDKGVQIPLVPTATSSANDPVESNDPFVMGQLPAVALTDADDTIANGGTCTGKTDGVASLAVTGHDAAGADVAISAGDIVYLDSADSEVNADDTNGVRFGYAMEDVASGATTTIMVKVGY